jgi:hypothetical protein
MSVSSTIKITRTGIEVNESPSDITPLESRMDAVEAKNVAQDGILGVNGGNISVLQGDVATNAAGLGDLAAVQAAVTALQSLSGTNETDLVTVNVAISALQDDAVSNASTLVAVQNALTTLESGKVANAEGAIVTLQGLIGDVQVTTLATQDLVDTKQNRVTSISQGFKDYLTSTIDAGVGDLNTVLKTYGDWSVINGQDEAGEDATPYSWATEYYGSFPGDARQSYNMKAFVQKGEDTFWYGKGPKNPYNTSNVAAGDNMILPLSPVSALMYAKLFDNSMVQPNVSLTDLYPSYSNVNTLVVDRELSPLEVDFIDTKFGAATLDVPAEIAYGEHADKVPLKLKPGQKLKKISTFEYKEDADDFMPRPLHRAKKFTETSGRNPSNIRLVYQFDSANVDMISSDIKWVLLRPASELYLAECLSHSTGFWNSTSDIYDISYQVRSHYEMETLKPLMNQMVADLTVDQSLINTQTTARITSRGLTSDVLMSIENLVADTDTHSAITTLEEAVAYKLGESYPSLATFLTYHTVTLGKDFSTGFSDAAAYAALGDDAYDDVTFVFVNIFSTTVATLQTDTPGLSDEDAAKKLLASLAPAVLAEANNNAFKIAAELIGGSGVLRVADDSLSINALIADVDTHPDIINEAQAKAYLIGSTYPNFNGYLNYHISVLGKDFSTGFSDGAAYGVLGDDAYNDEGVFTNIFSTTVAALQTDTPGLSDEDAAKKLLAELVTMVDTKAVEVSPSMGAGEAAIQALAYYTKNTRLHMWSLDHQAGTDYYTTPSVKLQAYLDRFQGKDLILGQDHGVLQYDYADYVAGALMEKAYNKYHSRTDIAAGGYLDMHQMIETEVLPALGLSHIKIGYYSDEASVKATSTMGVNWIQFREKWAPDKDYGYRYLLHNTPDYWTVGDTQYTFGHQSSVMNCTMSEYTKILRVVGRGGLLEDNTRFLNAEVVERLLHPLMLAEDLDATVHLRGATDDCFGARWRNMTPLGGTARGPNIDVINFRRLDLLTKFVNDNERFPFDVHNGEIQNIAINRPPARCILIQNNPDSLNNIFFFPDLDMTVMLNVDDGTIATFKEFGGIALETSNEVRATLTGTPYVRSSGVTRAEFPTVVAGPNEDLSGVAHLNP